MLTPTPFKRPLLTLYHSILYVTRVFSSNHLLLSLSEIFYSSLSFPFSSWKKWERDKIWWMYYFEIMLMISSSTTRSMNSSLSSSSKKGDSGCQIQAIHSTSLSSVYFVQLCQNGYASLRPNLKFACSNKPLITKRINPINNDDAILI